jgi:uncharacterized membrane protein
VPGAVLPPLPADLEYCVVARRNDSLGTRRRWLVFGALALVSLGLALIFALAGAWPVVPYAALEVSVLAVAFAYVERHARDWERLTVVGDRVVVERAIGGRQERREFNRLWVRVEVNEGGMSRVPHVTLHSSGIACAFGDTLPVRERTAMARELRRLIGARNSGR